MNLKTAARIILAILATNILVSSQAQFQTYSMHYYEVARDLQLNSKIDSSLSFCVRPVYSINFFSADSIKDLRERKLNATQISKKIYLLPIELTQQFNTH